MNTNKIFNKIIKKKKQNKTVRNRAEKSLKNKKIKLKEKPKILKNIKCNESSKKSSRNLTFFVKIRELKTFETQNS